MRNHARKVTILALKNKVVLKYLIKQTPKTGKQDRSKCAMTSLTVNSIFNLTSNSKRVDAST